MLILVIWTGCCNLVFSGDIEKENLLSNPGFEEAGLNPGQPKYWSRFKVQGGLADTDMKGERTSEDCHSGKAAYKITGTARAGMKTAGCGYAVGTVKFSSPYPSRVVLKRWVKADISGGTRLYAWVNLKGEKKLQYAGGREIRKTDGWQEDSMILDYHNKEITAVAVLTIAGGEGTVYLDDFSVSTAPPRTYANVFRCRKVAVPPVIDGKLNDPCWEKSGKLTPFILANGIGCANEPTVGYLAYDDTKLYIAFECFESRLDPVLNLLHEFKATEKGRDANVFNDDCVEIFLDAGHDHSNYYHLAVNALGTLYDAKGMGGDKLEFRGQNRRIYRRKIMDR
ncbi:MAG: carbohydrate-binding family 9-like protein [Victivallaceae bacterium]|nr:carbohydrate-binding family 9-like protein [Victivallaceae bacterium]